MWEVGKTVLKGSGVEMDCGGFDTDSDTDGEPRKQQSGVGFSNSHELFRLV